MQAQGQPKPSDIAGLRKEFTGVSGEFSATLSRYKNILSAQPGGAGDIALVFNYVKLFDPTSTVSAGEAANVGNAGGVPANIRNLYNRIVGGDSLAPELRDQIRQQAGVTYQEIFELHQQQRQGFTDIAEDSGIDPDLILKAVPAPSPRLLQSEFRTGELNRRVSALGADMSTIERAAQELSQSSGRTVTIDEVILRLEEKRQQAGQGG